MIQTNALARYLTGRNFAIEPNVIISPSGSAAINVYRKI